jgi:adenylate cyclase class 2
MKEIEVKIIDIDPKKIKSKLISMGAKKIFDNNMHVVFFDTKESTFEKTNQTFRLRQEADKVIMTYKRKIPSRDAKLMEELEVDVSNLEDAKRIILALGYKEVGNMNKRRVSYKIGNVKFEFDKFLGKYNKVPEFLEIEAPDKKTLYKAVKTLGFSKEDCKAWTGKDVINHYLK